MGLEGEEGDAFEQVADSYNLIKKDYQLTLTGGQRQGQGGGQDGGQGDPVPAPEAAAPAPSPLPRGGACRLSSRYVTHNLSLIRGGHCRQEV